MRISNYTSEPRATHVPDQRSMLIAPKFVRITESQMLQLGFRWIVTAIACRLIDSCRNVDFTSANDTRSPDRISKACERQDCKRGDKRGCCDCRGGDTGR